ncbi:MAG: putative phospholipid-binding protein MlaC [Candidatus Moanabacter tarae]|uniref:Putative phospholipid-binding protein MlaC n=1 Tax=Candidatus Moanibacter tarae TaxID=2200854 RepID=A0A2Z4ABQ8_9BACT|nr:MAG: putative phospholipid-binding protein MlaC [Candidatus Moanabacter tarae]|tara:strand:- start:7459 stop:8106 length:648 start_codon:yes stop_codon:yes gene_type:complete
MNTTNSKKNTELVLASFFLLSVTLSAEEKPKAGPETVVHTLQSNLIDTMNLGPEFLFQGRYEKLGPVILQTHHIPYIARLTIGRYWKEINHQERREFIDRFGEYVVSDYASKFKKSKGEYFKSVSEKELKRGRKLIVTDLCLDGGDTVRFNYILRQFEDNWKIINVIVKGISDLAMKRAEFTSIIEKNGFPALLIKLQENVEKIRQRSEGEKTLP